LWIKVTAPHIPKLLLYVPVSWQLHTAAALPMREKHILLMFDGAVVAS
jgi:hypothetical protein